MTSVVVYQYSVYDIRLKVARFKGNCCLFSNWGINTCWLPCGYFYLSLLFSWSQAVMKKSSNDTFFVQKEILGRKIIIWMKLSGSVFTQIMMLSAKKVDNLRAREREEKGTTYRISANCFRGNYSFLKKSYLLWPLITVHTGNYSREETIQGRKVFAEII